MLKSQNKILLAEDDVNLGILLMDFLGREGYEVLLYKDGVEALNDFPKHNFMTCLLDVMMPKMDGYTLARNIREFNKSIPIIFITAKSLKEEKMKGYNLGADDYITKPFDEEELLWKIKALVRRTKNHIFSTSNEKVQIGKYHFDFANQLLCINNQSKRITEKESKIIYYLFTNSNCVVKRETLLTDLWGENDYFYGRSLDVFITKIRKYFKEDPNITIENVFKVGFVMNISKKE